VIACRNTGHGSGLGVHRWVVEQSIALLRWFRRLRIRDDIHEDFLSRACSIICWRRLVNHATLLGALTAPAWPRKPGNQVQVQGQAKAPPAGRHSLPGR